MTSESGDKAPADLKTEFDSKLQDIGELDLRVIDNRKTDEKNRPDRHFRQMITFRVFWLLVGTIVLLLSLVSSKKISVDDLETISLLILSPVISIFGTITGFFFGSNDKR